ncbi:unnamed protein product [Lactuca virosa]|uniref:Uncharacterized protein n=1 Tax=Lactuca virosa TaxID=75947 RepID=A0AAU9L9A7_9ASTR|nr:unnamed protein product [Lactuca virosa]
MPNKSPPEESFSLIIRLIFIFWPYRHHQRATVCAVSTDYSNMAAMNSVRIDAAKMTSINDLAARILVKAVTISRPNHHIRKLPLYIQVDMRKMRS